ncbi:phage stabilization protein [Luteimonas cucumeris]|uniref:Phage stabilization protein n=1 Tax=Luteimonas cucumeris TaxID=985012 RepID=A0A562LBG7_9GAMM|nr:packaged DNA stabilization protein [Luteimonas cucumeris]TWI04804.1 phage stabilization protein [Luteimonas cucumeris]
MRTDFLGAAYQSRSLPLAGQTLVNLFFEPAPPGSAEPGMFYGSPGLRLLFTVGAGPIRGALTANGFGWIVSGSSLYRITSAGVATLVGSVPGTGRVHLQNNDTQLVVMHSSGWNVVTLATLAYASVADAPTTAQGTYQDSYIVFPNANGTYGWTNIADATSLDGLNFASAEAQPDPIIAVISDHRELWLFGEVTVEIAQTSGDADLVFTRTAIMEYGCAAKYTPAKSDNTVFWLGRNASGQGTVYKAAGYSPSRISTHALESAIAGYGDISDAWAYCYQQNGHTFYVLTFPNRATWAYDASSDRWTQLSYRNTLSGLAEQHRGNAYLFLAGQHIVGDHANGNLYVLDLDTYTDNGDPIYRERAWAVIEDENRWVRHHQLELSAEMGVGLDGDTSAVGANPKWLLSWSDDGCRNYSNDRVIEIGRIGQYRNRGIARRLGISRRRVYRIRTSEPVRIAVYGANLKAEVLSR